MMNQEHRRPVSLEDLLRLKRAERPPVEFWNEFDRELRAKQLAALVEKRPWWRTLPDAFGSLSRYHLPLGATAILALTVLTVREYRTVDAEPAIDAVGNLAETVTPAMTPSNDLAVSHFVTPTRQTTTVATVDNENATDSTTLISASETTSSDQRSRMISESDATSRTAYARSDATPAARFIAANLALAQAAEPAIAQNLLGASRGFEARAMPARTPVVDPLSQMASPSDVRRSRLLNGAAVAVSMNTVVPTRTAEFHSRRLSDDQLYDTVSRFGARGNSVLVKF